ncbi:MAG: hypothetical protein M3114_05375 [Thermoproteota archaeon]|nr:hypothetical protein [Thermoproteota archaeon]
MSKALWKDFQSSFSIASAILKEDMFCPFVMKAPLLPSSQSSYENNIYG